MLYQLHETQRALGQTVSDLAQSFVKASSGQQSIFSANPFLKQITAGYELMHRMGKDYKKPSFALEGVEVDGVEVAVHERVEIDKPFCELRRFKRFTDNLDTLTAIKKQPVVLIVAPLSGHHATLLRDTVKTMLSDHRVYITDWKNARDVPLSEGEFHLDDYVNYVQEFVRHLQATYGNCHLLSVCQPTVPVLAAVSLMASRGELEPLSMTVMGGPIDARRSPTAVDDLAVNKSHEWFKRNVIHAVPNGLPGAGRLVYPGFLQHTGFIAMNPGNHTQKHIDFYSDLVRGDEAGAQAHRKFYDEYNAVLDMDANYYLETIKVVFQEFSLANHTWDVKGVDGAIERVRPQDIAKTAIFSVEGELDDISGAGQTEAIHDLCTGIDESKRKHLWVADAGHYGIFSGHRWREVVYPQVKAFIKENSLNKQ